ncbi:MAG: hypothetical protein ACE5KS_09605, partial [Woeseiaceae bacterium]
IDPVGTVLGEHLEDDATKAADMWITRCRKVSHIPTAKQLRPLLTKSDGRPYSDINAARQPDEAPLKRGWGSPTALLSTVRR